MPPAAEDRITDTQSPGAVGRGQATVLFCLYASLHTAAGLIQSLCELTCLFVISD